MRHGWSFINQSRTALQGLADSVSMVAGNIEQSECISLKPGQDPGEFKEKVRQAVEELDTGMGVLC